MRAVAADPYRWPFDGAFTSEDTGLIVLGMQTAYVDEVGRPPALDDLSRAWRGPTILARRGVTSLDDLAPVQRWRNDRLTGDRVLERGTAGWRLAVEAEPALILDHAGTSAFYATDLAHVLARKGIRNLLFAGLRTDGLVHTTMRDANDRGFECLLVSDACASDTSALHDGILRLTAFGNGLFGAVADTASVLESLRS